MCFPDYYSLVVLQIEAVTLQNVSDVDAATVAGTVDVEDKYCAAVDVGG